MVAYKVTSANPWLVSQLHQRSPTKFEFLYSCRITVAGASTFEPVIHFNVLDVVSLE